MKDIFGTALWNYFKGDRKSKLILKREDGEMEEVNLLKYFASYESFSKPQKLALKYVKGKVLDIGCGAGKHALYLQQKGFDVTGVEISKQIAQICKIRSIKKIKVSNILKLNLKKNSFDTLILFGNNMTFGGNHEGIKKLLKGCYNITREDGILLLDGKNAKSINDGVYSGIQKKQMKFRWEYNEMMSEWFSPYFVSLKELKEILEGTGWKIKELFEDNNFGEYSVVLKRTKK